MSIATRIAALGLLFGAVGLASCNDRNDLNLVPTINNVLIGTFGLRAVNGARVPTAVLDSSFAPDTVIVQSGAITINVDNTFSDAVGFLENLNGVGIQRTVRCAGTYTRNGTFFTFVENLSVPNCGRTFTGVVTGPTLQSFVRGVPALYSTQPIAVPISVL
jgi:hypothetical protein